MMLFELTIRVSNGTVARTIVDCAIGRAGHHTPEFEGLLSNDREKLHISHKHHPPMPFALFFKDGRAFHEGATHLASHRCIHLNFIVAEWLFDQGARNEAAVSINGNYPQSPVRAP